MRFALVTSQFPTAMVGTGGLSTHTVRLARLLANAGHEVEVFAPHPDRSDRLNLEGYVVRHVRLRPRFGVPDRFAALARMKGYRAGRPLRDQAHLLAEAVEKAHARQPFDVVHSADHLGVGRFIPLRRERLLVVRCSSAADLYNACDGKTGLPDRVRMTLEQETVARADLAFAPSRFIAEHYGRTLGRVVEVISPPATAEVEPLDALPWWMPERYLLHFGAGLTYRKGSDLVAAALVLAWEEAPDLQMIWVGKLGPDGTSRILKPLGDQVHRMLLLHPQPKPVLYAMIRHALCTVLPSRVDNLPNTVIESLLLGTPVIGSDASSIEELVEPGVTGALVPNGSVEALAEAMVQAWRGGFATGPAPRFDWRETALGAPLTPEAALASYLGAVKGALGKKRAG